MGWDETPKKGRQQSGEKHMQESSERTVTMDNLTAMHLTAMHLTAMHLKAMHITA